MIEQQCLLAKVSSVLSFALGFSLLEVFPTGGDSRTESRDKPA